MSNFLAARSDRRRLKVVAIDMRREFRDAVQEQCPWALIVIDRFHVIKSATKALHNVRKRVARHPQRRIESVSKVCAICLAKRRRT